MPTSWRWRPWRPRVTETRLDAVSICSSHAIQVIRKRPGCNGWRRRDRSDGALGDLHYGRNPARFTEKRNSQACFLVDVSMKLPDATAAYVFRDGNGQQVGTGTSLTNSDVVTVTCNGSAPVQLSQACIDVGSVASSCNTGVCT